MQESQPTIKGFVRAFGGQWFTKMSGPLTVPFTFAALLVPGTWLKGLFAVLAISSAAVASYGVWAAEHRARQQQFERAEEEAARNYGARPQVDLGVFRIDDIDDWIRLQNEKETFVFYIQNLGQSAARFVEIDPIPSKQGKFTLHFDKVDGLVPNMRPPIRFEVRENGKSYPSARWIEMLIAFFRDSPSQQIIEFEVAIRYRDLNNAPLVNRILLVCEFPVVKLSTAPIQN